jgi:flagellar hook assembly protein FlgD
VVRIHYKPQKDGPVTIKIYDFAMNLVTTLRDTKSAAGIDQDKEWDGKNDKGDTVANGVYFFKVEAPGGQTEWGKLVILK